MCVYSRTLPSALCANVELKRPLHCAGSFPREKAIESVSSERIEAGLKLTVNEDLAGVENKLPLGSAPSTRPRPGSLIPPSAPNACLGFRGISHRISISFSMRLPHLPLGLCPDLPFCRGWLSSYPHVVLSQPPPSSVAPPAIPNELRAESTLDPAVHFTLGF